MALEDLELNVGGTHIKGVWVAIVLSFASSIGAGIWATSEFFGRLEAQEKAVSESMAKADALAQRFEDMREMNALRLQDMDKKLATMQQSLDTADITQLQGKLSELGANLVQIMDAQKELLDLRDRIASVEKSNSETVISVDGKIQALETIESRMKRLEADMDSAWLAMDELANPLGR